MKLKNLLPFFIAISFCATKRANTLDNFGTELRVTNSLSCIDSNNKNEYQQSNEIVEKNLNDHLQKLKTQEENLIKAQVAYTNELHTVARIHQSKREYDEAINYYCKASKFINTRMTQKKNIEWASRQHNLGECFYAKGKYFVATSYYYEALSIYEKEPSKAKECGDIFHKVGDTHEKTREFIYATEAYKKALAIRKKLGRNQPDYKSTLNRIAHVYEIRNAYDQAIIHFSELLELIENKVDKTDLKHIRISNKIKSLYKAKSEAPIYILWRSCIGCLMCCFC